MAAIVLLRSYSNSSLLLPRSLLETVLRDEFCNRAVVMG